MIGVAPSVGRSPRAPASAVRGATPAWSSRVRTWQGLQWPVFGPAGLAAPGAGVGAAARAGASGCRTWQGLQWPVFGQAGLAAPVAAVAVTPTVAAALSGVGV